MANGEWDEDAHVRDDRGRFVSSGTIWYLDQRFAAHAVQHAAEQRAIEVADSVIKTWKADANEWRGTLGDRDKAYATKADLAALADRVYAIERADIARDVVQRTEKASEAEDKRQSERRIARAQWGVGVVVGLIAAGASALATSALISFAANR